MGRKSSTGKHGSRKLGRNKIKCERYRANGTREKNKARRMAKRKRILDKFRRKRESRLSIKNQNGMDML